MKTSQEGIDLIKKFEGLRLTSYTCTGNKLTIGYGHTATVKKGMRITKEQAEELLKKDLEQFEKVLLYLVKIHLDQNEFDALVSFCFNIGAEAFRKSTLLKEINSLYFDKATLEFHNWKYSGGKVTEGLIRRRVAEALLFSRGAYD